MTEREGIMFSIVVPLRNEEKNIRTLYLKIVDEMDGLGESYEIIFVDDGSEDSTYACSKEISEYDPRVTLIRLRRNFGQTAALQAGFDVVQGEIVISMDGDLQHDPAEIPRFITKLREGYDMVCGWRVKRTDAWLTRRVPSRTANWLLAQLSGVGVHDFGTTFRAYRREIIRDLRLYGEHHRFIPALASRLGARIAEIPISNTSRKNGRSNYGLSRTIRVLLDLISIKFLLDYLTRPLQFFGLFGILGTGLGSLLAAFLLYKKFVLHESIMMQHGPLLFTATLLILSGLQLLSVGLIGEMVTRTYFESQRKPTYSVREILGGKREAVSAGSDGMGPGARSDSCGASSRAEPTRERNESREGPRLKGR
jgi:glycosyltransferase involved in cell wall biosynthesis